MAKKTIRDIDLSGKRVIMRVDFNVPLKGSEITDDTRIQAALPTIRAVLEERDTSLVLMSHLGRPKGKVVPELSLAPVAARLSELLGRQVEMAEDSIGDAVRNRAESLKAGEVLLLENLRFHAGEEANDPDFARELASLGDVYVNDAFGTAHRAHASTEGIARVLPGVAGLLMEKEIRFLGGVLENPEKPMVAIIGGAKVSTKIAVLESLLERVDTLIIGGGMSFTFLKVQGHGVGKSLVEDGFADTAADLLKKAERAGVELMLPVDHLAAAEFSEEAEAHPVDGVDIPDGMMGLDIGPKTLDNMRSRVLGARTLVWNGPVGVAEFPAFANGTRQVAEMAASCEGTTVVGGGDSVAAVKQFGLEDRIDHVSTGGGASLEYLEGRVLPGIAVLQDKEGERS